MTDKTLLIVDDSPLLHRLARECLRTDSIIAYSAFDADSAMLQAAQWKPSLILLDVNLPSVDGFELCRRFKASPITNQVPVIFLTAEGSMEEKVKGLDLGAIDYIVKPFTPQELCARVRTALRSKQDADSINLFDPLTHLWNKAYFNIQLPIQISLARRLGRPMSCVVMELDSMELLEDSHGHLWVQEIIQSIANIIFAQSRDEDILCFCGHCQFVALMPGTSGYAAENWAQRARAAIAEQLGQFKNEAVAVTCSFGIADSKMTGEVPLFEEAEAVLCQAKRLGGNAVRLHEASNCRKIHVA